MTLNTLGSRLLKPWQGYGLATVSTAATLGLRIALEAPLEGHPTLVMFTMPIMVSAYAGGWGPGILATALASAAAGCYLLPPMYSVLGFSWAALWQQVFVATSGLVISALNEALRRSRDRGDVATEEHQNAQTALRESEARHRAVVDWSPEAIVIHCRGVVLFVNPAAVEMAGAGSARALVGGNIFDRIHPQFHELVRARVKKNTIDGGIMPLIEQEFVKLDGTHVDVEVQSAAILYDGQPAIFSSIRDIGQRKADAAEIQRLTRLYAALGLISQAIVRTPQRAVLLPSVCRILVEEAGFQLAWIGWHSPDTNRLLPVAECGDHTGYLQATHIYADDGLEGAGPTGMAFRTGRPCICNDLLHDATTVEWREEIRRRPFRAAAVFPIRVNDQTCGTLSVYANTKNVFLDKEIVLLAEVAADISFGLANLTRDNERRAAEATALSEQFFSETLIGSLPGVVYVYDEHGRFMRWNHNFIVVSGYSAAEIAQMHPLDFFTGDDRLRVEQRIADVFTAGHAAVEAAFVSKGGRTTPYFFTGTRVVVHGTTCLVGMGIDISERKQAHDRLAASERKYRDLVEQANSIILRWNAAGQITFINEFGERFFDYSAEELLGRHVIGTIVPSIESDGRDLERLMAVIHADPLAYAHSLNENMRRNGDRVSIAWTNRIVSDADGAVTEILSVGTDMTEQIRAERALRASEERYRTTLGSILEGCQLIGFDWRYLYLNDAAAVQNRRPNAALLGRRMMDVWPDIAGSDLFAVLRRCMDDRTGVHAEVEFVFPDGSSGWFDVRSQPAPEGIFVLSIDITDRKRAEMALRELNDTLELKVRVRTAELADARDRAESADRVKSAFLATMSHELRTPLNSIIGFTSIVLERFAGPLTPEQSKQLRMVLDGAHHLLALINDVLDLSKIEVGQFEIHAESFDVRTVLEHVTASLRPLADTKGLSLTVIMSSALGEMASDRRRVEQIVINLLNNALKFTESGGVTLTADIVVAQRMSCDTARPALRLRVADTGIGITPEDLLSLFQPFHQLDAGLARQNEGTGLGLAISQRLAKLLGGEIEAISSYQVGSEFTLTIPLQLAGQP